MKKKNNKIGIMTFYDTTNYGALFQMYALQKKVKEICSDSDVSIVRYSCEAVEKRENLSIFKASNLKDLIKNTVLFFPNKSKHKKFLDFCNKNMKFSSKIYNYDNHSLIDEEFDSIIVGSDQVWNNILTANDFGFFLPECRGVKKYSYAASFGKKDIEANVKEKITEFLTQFRGISCREKDGSNIVESLGLNCSTVLDPTFLLSKADWEHLSESHRTNEKYILMYLVQDRDNTFKYAKKLAKKHGLKIKYVNISPRYEFGVENIFTASPIEFLSLIENAKYIITGSYHGVALSINYQKNFIYELNKGKAQFNSRIHNLLSSLDLLNRIIDFNNFDISDIDYLKVNQKLDILRLQSYDFLNGILGDMYE